MSAPMPTARKVRPAGDWSDQPVDTVTLDYEQRYRRRIAMTGHGGLAFLLDLAEAVLLHQGDGLELEEGGIVKVEAADEPLVEITMADRSALTRIAWHLGNRHCPTQLTRDGLRIRRDHVIEAMLEGLGGSLKTVSAAFDPEQGAYQHH